MDHMSKALEDHRALGQQVKELSSGLTEANDLIRDTQSKLKACEVERSLYKARMEEIARERDFYMRQTTELFAEINSISALITDSVQKVRMGQYRNNGAAPKAEEPIGEIPEFLLTGPDAKDKIQ